ncbi:MAG: phosphoribosylformylglycinamidine synthase [Paludibacter sp.]
MIHFFQTPEQQIYAVQSTSKLSNEVINKLTWLFGEAKLLESETIPGNFTGPRREMITPWSTNAVEITQNMGIDGIIRIEEFTPASGDADHDPMLQRKYTELNQDIFTIHKQPDPIQYINDIAAYNIQEGLALSEDEIEYLNGISKKTGRKLTDSEVFGFSQVNSEHCRHKIFNGQYVIDGEEKERTLFQLIKQTSEDNPNDLVSAYKDNVAFNQGPVIEQFAPQSTDKPDFFGTKNIESVISLKAETHNFPTTVEPFNGAATGTGGEIRDRLGGGKASLPIAGTAVYMTSYPRNNNHTWEKPLKERKWLYQTPEQILIKASNGASDFGNKFGQPLICGSLLTFEHEENEKMYGYDKVIMLAGGVGFANKRDALKGTPEPHEKVVVIGGDNYRIGMGGGAVSSVETGQYGNAIELNAVQRANAEMQKRTANVIRALAESDDNPIVSIHDHGAGGHLNCLSELVESTGGVIEIDKLPIGDVTLSAKEIIGNESQERMGLLLQEKDIEQVKKIAERERAPMYVVGETTGDMQFVFEQKDKEKPIDLQLEYLIGKPPRTIITDNSVEETFAPVEIEEEKLLEYVKNVLQMEAVACKDWLTNKVDRSVTGKVARQQCVGEIQLPLSDLGAVALDYRGKSGIATSIGHAPQVALINPEAGSLLAVAEALTNIVWAPLKNGLDSVSLSANWMWPSKNPGEDARLYKAVEACSEFAVELGINIPTGKDSLSMTQKYPDGSKVYSPGTVIISAGAEVSDIRKIVSPLLINDPATSIYYIDFSFDRHKLGGSVLAQTLNKLGTETPTVNDAEYFKAAFDTIQELINKNLILAGHDISAGGMITTLLEMCFANNSGGLNISLDSIAEASLVNILFAENPGIIIQVKDKFSVEKSLKSNGIGFAQIGQPIAERRLEIHKKKTAYSFSINELRDVWYETSYLLDRKQSGEQKAKERFQNYKNQPLEFKFPENFKGRLSQYGLSPDRKPGGLKAAIIREKGTNGEREMAYALYLAGFDVKDVHMTDLASGRETLEDLNLIVFCGGFSNSDVLGSAKGWAGGFLYNERAKTALENYYKRSDTLSLGICNGCQLLVELNLINPEHPKKAKMLHNDSHKFESEYVSLNIPQNDSVMFKSLSGSKLGIWVAHGEGKFSLPMGESAYNVVAKYNYNGYPANPNGSDFSVAGICSADGRHLAMMPHLERAVFPWQCAHYPADRINNDEITPWVEAFVNARKWIVAPLTP